MVDRSPLVDQYLPPRQPTTTTKTSTATSPASFGQTPAAAEGQGESKLNRKQQLIQQNIELRKKFETMVLQWQEVLLDPVTEETLGEAVSIFFFSFLHLSRKQEPTNVNVIGNGGAILGIRDIQDRSYISAIITYVLLSIGEPHQTVSLQRDHRGEKHCQALRISTLRQVTKGMSCCSPSFRPYLCYVKDQFNKGFKKNHSTDYFISHPFCRKIGYQGQIQDLVTGAESLRYFSTQAILFIDLPDSFAVAGRPVNRGPSIPAGQ